MNNILLVSETYMRDNLPISRNIDFKLIKPNIQASQDLWLQDCMGSEFLEHILIEFSGQTLTPDEEILILNYIKTQVAYRSLAMTLPFSQNQIVNKGVQKQREDYSEPTSFQEFKFLLNSVENRAQFYEDRLVKYLCDNSNLFPLYRTQDGIISPNDKNGFNSGGLIFY